MSREAALKAGGQRIAIDTPMVDGSILLKGARLDDLRASAAALEGELAARETELLKQQAIDGSVVPTSHG